MKNLFITLFLLLSNLCLAQTKNDIFNPKVPMVCFGADYSMVQFTKAELFDNKPNILNLFVDCNSYFNNKAWQEMMRKKLKRDEIKTDLSYVTKNNGEVDWQKVFTDNVDFSLSDDEIQNIIIKLNIDQSLYKDYIGIIFCEENCSKTNKLGKVAVVFFDIDDLKPILIKHYEIKPNGIGFLFYWVSVNQIIVYNELGKLYKEINN
jgi:hypothetical protein